MRIVTVEPIPNQALTVVLDDAFWELRLVTCKGALAVSIKRNNETLVDGARAVAGELIIQQKGRSRFGNFAILTNNGDLVDYSQFGVSQFLAFITPGPFIAPPVVVVGFPDVFDFTFSEEFL